MEKSGTIDGYVAILALILSVGDRKFFLMWFQLPAWHLLISRIALKCTVVEPPQAQHRQTGGLTTDIWIAASLTITSCCR